MQGPIYYSCILNNVYARTIYMYEKKMYLNLYFTLSTRQEFGNTKVGMKYERVNSALTQHKGNFNLVFQALIQNMLSQRGMSFNLLYTESTRIDFSVDRVSAEYCGAH